jgi:hypothetical protein
MIASVSDVPQHIMTADARLFHRQARTVSHFLELFKGLKETGFNDPRMVIQGLFDLIDQTVRLAFLWIIYSVISD